MKECILCSNETKNENDMFCTECNYKLEQNKTRYKNSNKKIKEEIDSIKLNMSLGMLNNTIDKKYFLDILALAEIGNDDDLKMQIINNYSSQIKNPLYYNKKSLLNDFELKIFNIIEKNYKEDYIIQCKVQLKNIIESNDEIINDDLVIDIVLLNNETKFPELAIITDKKIYKKIEFFLNEAEIPTAILEQNYNENKIIAKINQLL